MQDQEEEEKSINSSDEEEDEEEDHSETAKNEQSKAGEAEGLDANVRII